MSFRHIYYYNFNIVSAIIKEFRLASIDNTDFLYLVCSEESFQEYDEAYNNGRILKEEYWSQMVKIFIEEIEKLHDGVNEFFRKDNRSSYFKIAYKEVLFPVVFTGKKKYYGIPHETKSNFNNKPFI